MEAEVDTWTRGQKEAEDAMLYNSQSLFPCLTVTQVKTSLSWNSHSVSSFQATSEGILQALSAIRELLGSP